MPQEEEHEKKRQKYLKLTGGAGVESEVDSVHNDFKRELKFYRQAQATVLEVIPRLQSMGVPTKRPDDYFAQMAKSDDHMNKVRNTGGVRPTNINASHISKNNYMPNQLFSIIFSILDIIIMTVFE